MEIDQSAIRQRRHPVDPFGAMPEQASRIAGLGGGVPSIEPGYVFRSLPIVATPGRAAFIVTVVDLSARVGKISFDLSAVSIGPNEVPIRIATKVVSIAELVASGGRVVVEFTAASGMLYAIAGSIHGVSDLTASAIRAELAEGPRGSADDDARAGTEHVDILRLASLEAPDFANPVSQPMTREQLQHPAYRKWAKELRLPSATPTDLAWAQIYALQALSRYGVLSRGARGIGINVGGQSLPTLLAEMGCPLVLMENVAAGAPSDRGAVAQRSAAPGLPASDVPPGLTIDPVDLRAPEFRKGDFDFAWSMHLDGVAKFEDSFWLGVHRLRSGGLYVHVASFAPDGDDDPAAPGRERVERLALNALSFGHDVAELKFRRPGQRTDPKRHGKRIPFALILRHV